MAVTDAKIRELADKISNDKDVKDKLGAKLGFSIEKVAKFEGIRLMLTEWRRKIPEEKQREKLRTALKGAGFVALANTCLREKAPKRKADGHAAGSSYSQKKPKSGTSNGYLPSATLVVVEKVEDLKKIHKFKMAVLVKGDEKVRDLYIDGDLDELIKRASKLKVKQQVIFTKVNEGESLSTTSRTEIKMDGIEEFKYDESIFKKYVNPDLMSLQGAKEAPHKTRMTLQGKVTKVWYREDTQKNQVDLTDGNETVSVSLWGKKWKSKVAEGEEVRIVALVKNNDYINSTLSTKKEKCSSKPRIKTAIKQKEGENLESTSQVHDDKKRKTSGSKTKTLRVNEEAKNSDDNVLGSMHEKSIPKVEASTSNAQSARYHPYKRPPSGIYKPDKPADPNTKPGADDMRYTMLESLSKGRALIVANKDFRRLISRPWANMDRDNMKELLEYLGYSFRNKVNKEDVYENYTAEEMTEAIRKFTRELDDTRPKPQSLMVYISSHGSEQGIYGKDGILSIQTVLKLFSGVLLGKPKVIIIDACWGGDETQHRQVSVANSGPGSQPPYPLEVPENSDTFVIHSTSYGKMSWSYTEKGSWFVDQLKKVMTDETKHLEDLDTIMLWVTKGISNLTAEDHKGEHGTQSTTVIKQGVTRKFYFYPGSSTTNA